MPSIQKGFTMKNFATTRHVVKLPRNSNAPHGNPVVFTTKQEAQKYLRKCCANTRLLTIPPTR